MKGARIYVFHCKPEFHMPLIHMPKFVTRQKKEQTIVSLSDQFLLMELMMEIFS